MRLLLLTSNVRMSQPGDSDIHYGMATLSLSSAQQHC